MKACCKATLQVWRRAQRAEKKSGTVLQSTDALNSVRPRGGAGATGVGAADSKLAVYEGHSGERGLLFVQARSRVCWRRARLRAARSGAACAACWEIAASGHDRGQLQASLQSRLCLARRRALR